MKSIETYFEEYSQNHTHPTNILIHKIAVPIIFLSTLGLLWCIKFSIFGVSTNLSVIGGFFALCFYFLLSTKYFFLMLLQMSVMYLYTHWVEAYGYLAQLSLSLFILAWIAQFIGHKIEGRRPSFFQDLSFLLIGPMWILRKP